MSIQVATTYDEMLEQTELTLITLDRLFERTKYLRYGQYLMNVCMPFISWTELYYEVNNNKAREIIRNWLMDNQNYAYVNILLDIEEKKLGK